jgi:hypothetical protein
VSIETLRVGPAIHGILALPTRWNTGPAVLTLDIVGDTQVLDAAIHLIAEVSLPTVRVVSPAVGCIDTPAALEAADATSAGDALTIGRFRFAAPTGALLTSDAILNLCLLRARVRGDAVVGPSLADTALTAYLVAGIRLARVCFGAAERARLAVAVLFTARRIDASTIHADARVAVRVLGTLRLRGATVVFTADKPRNTVAVDKAALLVDALSIAGVADAELTIDIRAGLLFTAAGREGQAQTDQTREQNRHQSVTPSLPRTRTLHDLSSSRHPNSHCTR